MYKYFYAQGYEATPTDTWLVIQDLWKLHEKFQTAKAKASEDITSKANLYFPISMLFESKSKECVELCVSNFSSCITKMSKQTQLIFFFFNGKPSKKFKMEKMYRSLEGQNIRLIDTNWCKMKQKDIKKKR